MKRRLVSILVPLGLGLMGCMFGWWIGNLMELTGILDPATFWKTDPENVWAWAAIIGGIAGLAGGVGLVASWRGSQAPRSS